MSEDAKFLAHWLACQMNGDPYDAASPALDEVLGVEGSFDPAEVVILPFATEIIAALDKHRAEKVQEDLMLYGRSFSKGGVRIDPKDVFVSDAD